MIIAGEVIAKVLSGGNAAPTSRHRGGGRYRERGKTQETPGITAGVLTRKVIFHGRILF